MKVDFRKITVENIDGTTAEIDVAKNLGNALYANGKTLEEVELARAIWKDGEVELTDDDVKLLQGKIKQIYPAYIIQQALLSAIKNTAS